LRWKRENEDIANELWGMLTKGNDGAFEAMEELIRLHKVKKRSNMMML